MQIDAEKNPDRMLALVTELNDVLQNHHEHRAICPRCALTRSQAVPCRNPSSSAGAVTAPPLLPRAFPSETRNIVRSFYTKDEL